MKHPFTRDLDASFPNFRKIYTYKHVRKMIAMLKNTIFFVVISFTQVGFAQAANNSFDKTEPLLKFSHDKGFEVQLDVKQMPIVGVIESVIKQTNIPIHYSALPEGLVNATCVGPSLKPVVDCLLAGKANLIVRNKYDNTPNEGQEPIAEAWIVGSNLGDAVAKTDCSTVTRSSLSDIQREEDEVAFNKQTEALLKVAQSPKPEERTEAMSRLLMGGHPGDPAVKATLEQGLNDKNEMVRAQAISSYARREGVDATLALQDALNDPSIQVRMMAVDGITDNAALLQQAINDSDETIRVLAATKLDALSQSNITISK